MRPRPLRRVSSLLRLIRDWARTGQEYTSAIYVGCYNLKDQNVRTPFTVPWVEP